MVISAQILAIEKCKSAGIKVAMATGDQLLAAKAIAQELGILENQNEIKHGRDLELLTNEQLDEKIEHLSAFARVSPTQKYRLVQSYQRKGFVTAMTGYGMNDAPALKIAEIDIGMGISGTDVTKETADIILAADNFATIVLAVEEGRIVYENLQKVIKYLISTSFAEIIAILLTLSFIPGNPAIFTPIQIL